MAVTYGESPGSSGQSTLRQRTTLSRRAGRATDARENMVFTLENQTRLEEILKRYPPEHRRAALLPALWLAQEQEGYLSPEAMECVARLLQLAPVHVLETASYYDMFRLRPGGRHDIRLCTNLSCSLLGAHRILHWLSRRLGIEPGETTRDGSVSLTPVQCLGSCEKAPMMQLDGRVEGYLSEEKLAQVLSELS